MPILSSSSNASAVGYGLLRSFGAPYREITFTSTPLNNFQVRVLLTTSNFNYSAARSDGGDIRFFSNPSLTTAIPYYIETWNSLGTSILWINVPVTGTTKAYMSYGNTALTTLSNIDTTMDPALQFMYYASGQVAAGAQAFQSLDGGGQDQIVNYSWLSGAAVVTNYQNGNVGFGSRTDYVSIRWKGFIKPSQSGTTTFFVTSDDGQRLYINDSMVVDNWADQGDTERSHSLSWTDGIPRKIQYDWFETGGGATAKIGWETPNIAKSYPISSAYYRGPKYHPSYGDSFLYSGATVGLEKFEISVVPSIVSNDLYFSLDAATYTSGSTWTDSSPNSRNGSLVGSPPHSTALGGYFDLNGSGQYVNMGASINLQQPWTLEIWVSLDNAARPDGFFGQGIFNTQEGLHLLHSGDTGRKMIFAFYANDNDYGSNFIVNSNRWYQFTFVYDRNNGHGKRLYVNGNLINPGTPTTGSYNGSGQFNIGAIYSSAISPMDGKLSIARMYSRPLTQTEIEQNFNAVRERYGV